MKTYTLNELKDEFIGKPGSEARDNYEWKLDKELQHRLSKEEILAGIKEGFEEVKLIKAGKLKGRPISELLDEL